MDHKQITCDKDKCSGCYACVTICLNEHYDIKEKGIMRREVIKEEDYIEETIKYYSLGCFHCSNAPCMEACPKQAIYRDKDTNMVLVNEDLCIGCLDCYEACPFNIPKFKNNKMVKCDGCSDRIKENLSPLCIQTCPTGALKFKDI